jgi:hypothetical protein
LKKFGDLTLLKDAVIAIMVEMESRRMVATAFSKIAEILATTIQKRGR